MTLHLGKVKPGSTIYIPFDTFAGSTGASVTMSGLAVGDIKIYKNGGTTERASTTGFTLLDTDGIDFDALTGIHGFSIDLSSNATADFYNAGALYWVVVSTITVDSQTVSFVAATFCIGYEGAILDTTIASLSSQTSFTLTTGPAEDDALNGCEVVIHDIASAVQAGRALVVDYTGSTKTVTLVAGTTFTAAAGDNISVFLSALQPTVQGRALDVSTGGEAGLDWANIGSPTTAQNLSATNIDVDQVVASVSGAVGSVTGNVGGNVTGSVASVATGGITSSSFATDAITATAIAADAIGASELAADAVAEIADAIWDEDATGHQTQGTFGQAIGDPTSDSDTIWGLVNTNLNATISSRASQTTADAIETDTQDIQGRLPAALVSGRIDSSVGAMASNTVTAAALAADAGAEIADAVWDEAASGHVTAGTFGQAMGIIRANTAQAGASGTITLDASASSTDDFYNNSIIFLTGGTGAGQARVISDYVGSTKVASVNTNWVTNPSSDTIFVIIPFGLSPAAAGLSAADVWGYSTRELTSGANLGTVAANVTQISGDSTAADNAEAFFDGTGYAGTGNTIPTVTTVINQVTANVTAISGDTTAADNAEAAFDGTGYNVGGGQIVAASVTASVTAGTVSDKTGYRLSATGVDDIWDEDATGHQTQGTFGQAVGDPGSDSDSIWALVNTNLDAAVSSRASQTSVNTIDDLLDTEVAAIITTLGTPAGASVSADIADVESKVDDLEGRLTATRAGYLDNLSGGAVALQSSVDSLESGVILTNAGIDAIFDRTDGVETGWTLRQALRVMAAALAGELSGAATTTITIRNITDTKARITATVDSDGNRTALTLDGS